MPEITYEKPANEEERLELLQWCARQLNRCLERFKIKNESLEGEFSKPEPCQGKLALLTGQMDYIQTTIDHLRLSILRLTIGCGK